jgi:hypothetical protein
LLGAGVLHLLGSLDDLLLLLCLLAPLALAGARALVKPLFVLIVAHSATLVATSATGLWTTDWFAPLAPTLVAAGILFVAIDNVVGGSPQRRWVAAAVVGVALGLAFSAGLSRVIQFAGVHYVVSVAAFVVGLEAGLALFLLAVVPACRLLARYTGSGRLVVLLLSALAGHQGWHWLADRVDYLGRLVGPQVASVPLLSLAQWAVLLLLAGTVIVLSVHELGRWLADRRADRAEAWPTNRPSTKEA